MQEHSVLKSFVRVYQFKNYILSITTTTTFYFVSMNALSVEIFQETLQTKSPMPANLQNEPEIQSQKVVM
jgi:ADP-glucose pyrophosphorylase